MLKNHLFGILTSNIGFHLTGSQIDMLQKLAGFIVSEPGDHLFVLTGFAGTGKTTMVNQLVRALEAFRTGIFLLAPTGRAAKVLMNYTSKPAFTIHKKIYRQKTATDGPGMFVLDKNLHRNTVFVVDEASMISNQVQEGSVFGSGKLLDDLLEYVYSGAGCRLILVGDTAQLPPVGFVKSPALDLASLENYGFGAISAELTDVVRQEAGSGVLFNATRIRGLISDGMISGFTPLQLEGFTDIERISGGDLIEKISWCYDRIGVYETIVLTRSNKRANLFNNGIRTSVLYRDSEIARGDLVMVVRNNYFWTAQSEEVDFIANGDIAEILHVYGYENLYGFRFADVTLRFIDYADFEIDCKIMLDALQKESPALPGEDNLRLFQNISEDYMEIRNKKERWKKIRMDPYFNALQVKFAYSITCHKAQGGQWKAVFVDTGYLTAEMLDTEFYRWLYTAFTRTTEKLFLVNFDKRFFPVE